MTNQTQVKRENTETPQIQNTEDRLKGAIEKITKGLSIYVDNSVSKPINR